MPSLLRNHILETGWAQGSSWDRDSLYAHIFNRGVGADLALTATPDLSPPHASFSDRSCCTPLPFPNALSLNDAH